MIRSYTEADLETIADIGDRAWSEMYRAALAHFKEL